jgi:hypothetical protein
MSPVPERLAQSTRISMPLVLSLISRLVKSSPGRQGSTTGHAQGLASPGLATLADMLADAEAVLAATGNAVTLRSD